MLPVDHPFGISTILFKSIYFYWIVWLFYCDFGS